MAVRLPQPEKAYCPMEVREDGKEMETMEEQFLKVCWPMEVRAVRLERLMDLREVQL
jgi:hypothetical protein